MLHFFPCGFWTSLRSYWSDIQYVQLCIAPIVVLSQETSVLSAVPSWVPRQRLFAFGDRAGICPCLKNVQSSKTPHTAPLLRWDTSTQRTGRVPLKCFPNPGTCTHRHSHSIPIQTISSYCSAFLHLQQSVLIAITQERNVEKKLA